MAIKHFDINSEQPTSLSKYSDTKIVVRKIEVIKGEATDLFNPIQVTTKLPTGELFQYHIHAITFYTNTRPGKFTDIPMEVVIQYCQFTEMLITPVGNEKIIFRIHYTVVEGNNLEVIVTKDLEGYTFGLTPSGKELIISKFKEARPISSIFLGYDTKQSLEMMHGKITEHIIPALTDLTTEQLDKLGEIKLIDSQTKREIKSL